MSISVLKLYSRHACHLCEVMQAELASILEQHDVEFEVLDVDAREEWRASYGLRVPLLCSSDGAVLSEYHLDEERLLAWLKNQAACESPLPAS